MNSTYSALVDLALRSQKVIVLECFVVYSFTYVVTSRHDYVRNVLWISGMSTPSRWRGNVIVYKCCVFGK